ncbi:MAG: hypothetical protein LBK23_01110 [Oscillospiraceae bacterium]|jgi:hypothetical protein|nr:hypothetical protein [Oscillospiraceae bacterium]
MKIIKAHTRLTAMSIALIVALAAVSAAAGAGFAYYGENADCRGNGFRDDSYHA